MTAKPARSRRNKRESSNIGMWLIGGGALMVLIVVAAVYFSQTATTVQPNLYEEKYSADWLNRNVLGNPDAPVTVQVWDDFL